jgi:3-hydroxymyristoyl/3-hydroxydecanoyl-(acyl carrier protein) dehydratase
MSFQLVDRINSFRPGAGAIGQFTPPPLEEELPLGLLVEAVGQLAGWVAMKKLDFAERPVAASAGRVVVQPTPQREGPLDLEVEITSMRHHALSYRGSVTVGGEPVLSLEKAIGPLLPMELFDDRERVRRIFETLRLGGLPARPLASPEDYNPAITVIESDPSRGFEARLRIPEASAVYADHFPRKPIYPATLLLDAQIEQARALLPRTDGSLREVEEVRGVKVRAFSRPGEELILRGRIIDPDANGCRIRLETWNHEARVSTVTAWLGD